MLTKNLNVSKGLVNGARGIIKRFESGSAGKFKLKITERTVRVFLDF